VSGVAKKIAAIYDESVKPRIAFHIADITQSGGTEKVTLQIVDMLKDKYNISLISTMRGKQPFFNIGSDVNVFYLFDGQISVSKKMLRVILRLRRLVRDERIDVLVGVDTMQTILNLPALFFQKTKYIAWEHFNYRVNLGKRARDVGRNLAAKRADKIIVLTDADIRTWRKEVNVGEKVQKIYNPVDLKEHDGGQYDLKSRRLLSVGRLTHQKGFDMVPEIVKKMIDDGQGDFEWWIVGSGEDEAKIMNKIREYGVKDFVKLKGNVKDMLNVYNSSAIFIMTSRFEGLPLVLLEAKQYEVPIVSFDYVMGVDEIIQDGVNGSVVTLGDAGKMAKEISGLLNNNAKRKKFSDAAKNNINKFDRKKIMVEWDKMLREVIR
jgi:glycosyltransferase involved in cell wall biosynthesis